MESSWFSFGNPVGQVNCTMTFCKRDQGFTRQPVSPSVHNWHRRCKNTTKIQRENPQREKKSENGAGEEKKTRNFGRSDGGEGGEGGVGGRGIRRSAQILDADTPHHNTTQRGIPHKVVLGKQGSLATRSMAHKTRHEQQIVLENSPMVRKGLGTKRWARKGMGQKWCEKWSEKPEIWKNK